jgi:hypothetical protein
LAVAALVVLVETLELKAGIAFFPLSRVLVVALGEMLMIFKKPFQTVVLVVEPLVAQADVGVLEQLVKDMKAVPQTTRVVDNLLVVEEGVRARLV